MYQHYHLFNVLNPEGVMEGEVPQLEEKSGYIYQEFDNFIKVSHETYNGNNIVRFHLLRYEKITENTQWADNVSPNDNITTFSLGAYGAWYQLKHLTRQQLALTTLYSLALGFENDFPLGAYSQSVSAFLGGFSIANKIIFQKAGIFDENLALAI